MKKLLWLLIPLLFTACDALDKYEEEIEKLADNIVQEDSTGTCPLDCECKFVPDNAKVVLWIGHSIGDGRGETVPVVPDSTLWLASRSGKSVEMVTDQTTSNDGDYGSSARRFAIDYKAYFGDPIVLVNRCSGGSDVSSYTDKNDWSVTGNLWAPAVAATRKTLLSIYRDTTDVHAIIIDVVINDIGANKSYSTIKTAYQNLIDRCNTEFPGVQILISQQGKVGSSGNLPVSYDGRRIIKELMHENTGVDIYGSDSPLVGAALLLPDGVHPNTVGNEWKGRSLAKWFVNTSLGYSRWSTSVLSTFYDEPLPNNKTLIANFIDSQVSNGNYFKFEKLFVYHTSTKENIFCDWSLMGYATHSKIVFVANSHINTNTSSTAFYTWITPSVYNSKMSVDNFIFATKITGRTTPITTVAYPFGGRDATAMVGVQQTGTGLAYYANDLTASPALAGDVGIIPGNVYAVYRNGTEKGLIKGLTTAATATVAYTAAANEQVALGCLRNSGSANSPFYGNFAWTFAAPYVDFDYASAVNGLEYLTSNWQTTP